MECILQEKPDQTTMPCATMEADPFAVADNDIPPSSHEGVAGEDVDALFDEIQKELFPERVVTENSGDNGGEAVIESRATLVYPPSATLCDTPSGTLHEVASTRDILEKDDSQQHPPKQQPEQATDGLAAAARRRRLAPKPATPKPVVTTPVAATPVANAAPSRHTPLESRARAGRIAQIDRGAPAEHERPISRSVETSVSAVTKAPDTCVPQQQQRRVASQFSTAVANTSSGYVSQVADYTKGDQTKLITIHSGLVENDRHLFFLDELEREKQQRAANTVRQQKRDASLWRQLMYAIGMGPPDVKVSELAETQRRELRVRLSMDDPALSEMHRRTHKMFVSACSLTEMRAAGVSARHLIEIGVQFDDWAHRLGYGLKELGFMQGTWVDAVDMGFMPLHIVSNREKSGPTVLASPPFEASFDTLERDLGFSVDEAVFDCGFTAADFAVFGETMQSLVRRGMVRAHAEAMNATANDFELSLKAEPRDIEFLFPGEGNAAPTSGGNSTNNPYLDKRNGLNARQPASRGGGARGYVENCKRGAATGEQSMMQSNSSTANIINGNNTATMHTNGTRNREGRPTSKRFGFSLG